LLVFIVLILVVGIIFFNITQKYSSDENVRLKQSYKLIERHDSLSGIIAGIYCNRGASIVLLSKGNELIFSTSRNYDYEIFELCCFISVGDSVQKKEDIDTLHIYKKEKEFYFVLGKFIGEKHNSRFYNNPCR
jgi:hypothetical protein